MRKQKLAIVRGKFLNAYEMQSFEPLTKKYNITAFGSLTPFHDNFSFLVRKLVSPMDLPDFPFKMPIINRAFVDAHYLLGLEKALEGYDIAHTAETYYNYTHQALIAKKKGYVRKVVATVLENIPFNNEGIHGRKSLKKQAIQELDHVIAISERTKDALILEGADSKKISVIGYGIDTKRFFPTQRKNKKNIEILFTGRLEVYKGVYEILYAFRRLLMDKNIKNISVHLTMVGNGSEKDRLLRLEEKLGVKNLVTHKEVAYKDMPEVYRQADIFVAPSKSSRYWIEQYNISLLEAQASGLPIITTVSGAIPENVGNAAILVQPDDFYSLYIELKNFIMSPKKREEYGKKARKHAVDIHDVGVIAKRIDEVYKSIL